MENLSEKEIRVFFDSCEDAVFILDTNYYVRYLNQAGGRFLGTTPDSIIGKSLQKLFRENFKSMQKNIEETLSNGMPSTFIDEIQFSDSKRRIKTTLIPIENGIIGISRDITKEKTSEEAEERFKSLVEQSIFGIYIIQDERFSYVNPKLAEIFGYSPKKMLHMPVLDVVAPESRPIVKENIRKGISGEVHSIRYELKGLRKDGTIIDCEVHGSRAIYDGRPAVMGALIDVSERKKAEAEIKRAERLQSLGIFAGKVGHEFNNLLTAILGNVSLAKMYTKPGYEAYDILVDIERASKKARELAQRLLTFAHGGASIKKTVDIRELLSTITPRSIHSEIPDGLSHVDIDEAQITDALNNVIEFLKKNSEGISLKAENIFLKDNKQPLRAGDYILISISGRAKNTIDIERLFDPFYISEDTELASSYSAIKKHDGLITAVSDGEKIGFYIYLPASKNKAPVKKEPEIALYGRGKVLVMDDDELVRTVLGRMLLQCGYDSDMAENGEEAIRLYKEALKAGKPYSAVIIDLAVKGGLGGKETIEELLKIDPSVKAIVSSGYSDDPILSDYKKYGFLGALAKPFEASDLGVVLSRVITGKEG